jgi:hypothetical protein
VQSGDEIRNVPARRRQEPQNSWASIWLREVAGAEGQTARAEERAIGRALSRLSSGAREMEQKRGRQ